MSRSNYRELELSYLDPQDLEQIEVNAKALSLEECYDLLLIDQQDLPAEEAILCKKAWRRGRCSAISTAANSLFHQMSARNGGQVAMEYLRALSPTFHLEPTDHTTSGKNFSFNVVLPEDDKPKLKSV